MTTTLQISIDCADPAVLVPFWATALGYREEEPPAGFATWRAYWISIGVPEDELGDPSNSCADSLVDPTGAGPRIFFQIVPETKTIKNRLHLDLKVGGGRDVPLETRTARVNAEAERLVAAGATKVRVLSQDGLDQYGVTLQDPEGNEFCVA
ncbi:VOC family protein [Streptomyces sp. RKAG337]|uniref:VOC family protein n=1 Tax=Streptomyces sp. RKAG337 TaxID=2893404 RepID=UPI0020334F34|nr:VOC family protein [Streptomyces sp. RKAG337]MCM2426161.1 VOC family protein [Streptomyces sp. RKAG337]